MIRTMTRKQIIFYSLLLAVSVSIVLIRLLTVNVGFNTEYDEAYFLLGLRDAYNGVIAGDTQWNLLMVHLFPFLDLYNKAHAYLANIILGLCSVGVLAWTTCRLRPAKGAWLRYLSLYMLSLTLFLYVNQELTYVSLLVFLFSCALSTLLLLFDSQKPWLRVCFAVLTGISMSLTIFTILPSALLVLLMIFVLILWRYWGKWNECGIVIASGIGGLLIGCAIFHLAVADLRDVFAAMQETAQTMSQKNRGYDPMSFMMQIALVMRDWIFALCVSAGAFAFSRRLISLSKTSCSWFRWMVSGLYVLIVLAFMVFQNKPRTSEALLFSSVVVLPWLIGNRHMEWRQLFSFKTTVLYGALFLFPLIASIGTNIYLGQRMGCFLFAWVMLFALLQQEDYDLRGALWIAASLIVLMPSIKWSYSMVRDYPHTVYFEKTDSPMSNIRLTAKQVAYFERVDSILMEYDFDVKNDILYGLNEDFATMYALNVQHTIRPYGIEDIIYTNTYDSISPDVILIAQWELDMVQSDSDKWTDWGWPETYARMVIASPDRNPDRVMFCRRK